MVRFCITATVLLFSVSTLKCTTSFSSRSPYELDQNETWDAGESSDSDDSMDTYDWADSDNADDNQTPQIDHDTFGKCQSDAECDDEIPCNGVETCLSSGSCQQGSPVDCSDLDGPCTTGKCDEATGGCAEINLPDGTSCDDGLECTSNDTCLSGKCGGNSLDCSHLNEQCRIGTCDSDSGECVLAAQTNGTWCDDTRFCTQNDSCQGGECSGAPRDCSHLTDQCSTGVCSDTANSCVSELNADPGSSYTKTSGMTRYACSQYPGIISCNSTTEITVAFTNPSSVTMNIFWIDYNGSLVKYGTMAPGGSKSFVTYNTHPWLIADVCGNCMTIYVKGLACQG